MSYLVDVLENLALAGALGATANPGGVPAVEAPGVVDALVPVELPDGTPRLWQPDLRPFAHDTVLPAGLTPDAQ
ncbi:hypothetical protein NL393_39230, partial [Klebsiella pneumoniae]|nr:hypothetical protein [Klebsiella pneumoniae]